MDKDDDYRKQAAEAQAMADQSISVVEKEAWLHIARGYMALVRKHPQTAAEIFTDEAEARGTKKNPSTGSH